MTHVATSPTTALYTAHFFIRVVRECAALDIAPFLLLHGTGVEPGDLHDTATRVTLRQTLKLADNALRLSGDPALGLKLGATTRNDDGGVASMAAQAAGKHFWRKIRLVERYHKLFGQILLPFWTEEQEEQIYRLTPPDDLGALLPFFVEEAFSAVRHVIDRNYQTRITPTVIRFAYAEPAHVAAYRDCFDCPLEFNAAHNEFVFNFLSLPSADLRAHPLNLALYQQMCEALDSQTGIVERVRSLLIQQGSAITMDSVAERLAMTSRTLARHLGQQGHSFQSLKDDVRLHHARQLLRHTYLSIDQIATATGFRSVRRFRDFFSRHLDQTPSAYRRAVQPS